MEEKKKKDIKEIEQEVSKHMQRYNTLSENLSQKVNERRINRRTEYEALQRRQALTRRLLWIGFLLLCCVVAFVLYTVTFDMIV